MPVAQLEKCKRKGGSSPKKFFLNYFIIFEGAPIDFEGANPYKHPMVMV